jgi:hypothetical protein
MKERLIQFLVHLGMGQTKFEEKVGLSRGFVNTLKDNLTIKTLKRITDAYPELNEDWLKTGQGEMLKNIQNLENVSGSVAIGRDANGSEIHITSQKMDEFIRIMEKNQEHTDRMLTIIEKLINK